MPKDPAVVDAYHRSSLRNAHREAHCAAVQGGWASCVPSIAQPDAEGWVTVSWHYAGRDSAFVQQAKLRGRWPALQTRVGDGTGVDSGVAVIQVKRKA